MSEFQKQLDTRALERAQEALTKAESAAFGLARHEDDCTRRYIEITSKLDRTDIKRSEQFKALHDRITLVTDKSTDWWRRVFIAVILALLAVVAYLLKEGRPWA